MNVKLDACSLYSQVNHVMELTELQGRLVRMRKELPSGWNGGSTSAEVAQDLDDCIDGIRRALHTISVGMHSEIAQSLGAVSCDSPVEEVKP